MSGNVFQVGLVTKTLTTYVWYIYIYLDVHYVILWVLVSALKSAPTYQLSPLAPKRRTTRLKDTVTPYLPPQTISNNKSAYFHLIWYSSARNQKNEKNLLVSYRIVGDQHVRTCALTYTMGTYIMYTYILADCFSIGCLTRLYLLYYYDDP